MGGRTVTAYTPTGKPSLIIDALDGRTSYLYDANDNVLAAKDPEGYTVSYTYDKLNRVATATDARGTLFR